ncbi:hypothetical protein ABHI18_012698 [Aspergillus niger]
MLRDIRIGPLEGINAQTEVLTWVCVVRAVHVLRILVELLEEMKKDILRDLKIFQPPTGPPNAGFPKGLKAVKRATKVNIALSGLRHLRPEQMRQLYQTCVTPSLDYASTVWHNPLRDKIHRRLLETVQRTALIQILSAFRTISTAALEVESYILPTHLRLKQRGQIVAARLSTLPDDNPVHQVISRAKERSTYIGSGARFPLAETLRTMNLGRLQALETIDPKPLAPWRSQPFTEIEIEPDREKAQANALAQQSTTSITVFSDASGKENQLGAAAVALDHNRQITGSRQISIGSMEHWSVYAAELMAIYYAIGLVFQLAQQKHATTTATQDPATILSDSMSALQVIANSWNKSGQRIIQAIHQSAAELKARGIPLRLQWVPGHCGDPRNETADRLAKEAVGAEKKHPFQHLLSREKAFIRNKIKNEWEQEWKTSKKPHGSGSPREPHASTSKTAFERPNNLKSADPAFSPLKGEKVRGTAIPKESLNIAKDKLGNYPAVQTLHKELKGFTPRLLAELSQTLGLEPSLDSLCANGEDEFALHHYPNVPAV